MCTVLLEPETLRAEKRSREDSQKAVDSLMAYERRLAGPLVAEDLKKLLKNDPPPPRPPRFRLTETEEQAKAADQPPEKAVRKIDDLVNCYFQHGALSPEELGEAFERHDWGYAHGWDDYRLLSDEEKRIVDGLGLAPNPQACPPMTEEEQQEQLSRFRSLVRRGRASCGVLRYDAPRGRFSGKSFYYIAFESIGSGLTEVRDLADLAAELGTASDDLAARWTIVLDARHAVVEKSKLRPWQISFLEARCAETEKELLHARGRLRVRDREEEERRRLWSRFELLTDEEKQLAGRLGLTPRPPKTPDSPDPVWGEDRETDPGELRRRLKIELIPAPCFDGPCGVFFGGRDNSGRIYVWLDNCCYGNSDKKGF